jgi:predicted transcriptional regulator
MNMIEFLQELDTIKSQLSCEAQTFLTELMEKNSSESVLTETGQKILKTMLDNQETYLNSFNAKQLGELLFMSARSVSGSMRKLVTEGYTEKAGANPVCYKITEKGIKLAQEF